MPLDPPKEGEVTWGSAGVHATETKTAQLNGTLRCGAGITSALP